MAWSAVIYERDKQLKEELEKQGKIKIMTMEEWLK